MMAVVLFAILGATANAGAAYWICFGFYCALKLASIVYEASKK